MVTLWIDLGGKPLKSFPLVPTTRFMNDQLSKYCVINQEFLDEFREDASKAGHASTGSRTNSVTNFSEDFRRRSEVEGMSPEKRQSVFGPD